ncbi:universal stress protein [Hydrogenophaga sp.]|jgi:nucleotide-binding universal stress UspA family protein|uniref:universal stress protein n=1 Tax=Hydrogenophaga sp. TaxID=1904254 RepID=UPI002735521F|nr:universal stress protein [Hydrogenophaga sp.]MDP3884170.1 universal stress protein [Hydrogenophaga sp.]
MTIDNKVLACVDQSAYADHVTDYAAWAAQRMAAPLELLHVIDRHPETSLSKDHSGSLTPNAQEHLLGELAEADEARTKAAREQGRLFLNRLRERALAAGVMTVDVRQRMGHLDETLHEQQAGVRLFVLGRRGESANNTQRDLGRNVERVVRALDRPILTVTEGFKAPERVLIAFDGSSITRRGVEMVAASPLFQGLPVHVLMSGKASQDGPKQMAWATETLESAGYGVVGEIVPGDPETTIAQAIQSKGIDLLVMGAYTHSPLRSLFVGSRTTDLLRSARIPTLLLR